MAMARCQAELLRIPPRSPDFHIVSRKLQKDATDQSITRESYQEFCDRVRRTIYDISHQLIDKTIESRNTHIADMIRKNGERLNTYTRFSDGLRYTSNDL